MMLNNKYILIQFHAAISLVGYWFIQAIFQLITGTASSNVSIVYDAFQLFLSLYIIKSCSSDFTIENRCSILKWYSIFMILYSIRIVWDVIGGPFVGIVSTHEMLMNFIMTVLHTFTGVWAMISSRKYINIDDIVKWVYRIGIITVLMIIVLIQIRGLGDAYREDRIDIMGGLHSLSMAKLGTIIVLASIHVLLNDVGRKKINFLIYVISIALAGWLTLASGARGSFVGLIISLVIFWLRSSMNSPILAVVAIVSTALFVFNIIPIFQWIGNYFPIISNRMLETIIENDQSNREILREQAYKIIGENPIFGYSYRLNDDATGYTCHNGVLDIALALGIPASILFVYEFFIKNIKVIFNLARSKEMFFASTLLIANLVSAMSGSAIDSNSFGFAIVLSASLYYYRNSNEQINI